MCKRAIRGVNRLDRTKRMYVHFCSIRNLGGHGPDDVSSWTPSKRSIQWKDDRKIIEQIEQT